MQVFNKFIFKSYLRSQGNSYSIAANIYAFLIQNGAVET